LARLIFAKYAAYDNDAREVVERIAVPAIGPLLRNCHISPLGVGTRVVTKIVLQGLGLHLAVNNVSSTDPIVIAFLAMRGFFDVLPVIKTKANRFVFYV
jgi:hypothetical protein